ncbi:MULTISPECIES: hypothetical protein [Salinimonas]|uniref:Uncharacterized protein n=2 Tax=Salinimonas TaxID=288793 RepID=A0A5B7YIU9_9ALTE|nr:MULTISPECIES: hypothetical protein [Salinimonas]MBD3587521.1 hypothetical protein [Salinimonas profundi]QCZ95567.1 hypothetical protein FBQ74_18780 [Salinimonas iocasae]
MSQKAPDKTDYIDAISMHGSNVVIENPDPIAHYAEGKSGVDGYGFSITLFRRLAEKNARSAKHNEMVALTTKKKGSDIEKAEVRVAQDRQEHLKDELVELFINRYRLTNITADEIVSFEGEKNDLIDFDRSEYDKIGKAESEQKLTEQDIEKRKYDYALSLGIKAFLVGGDSGGSLRVIDVTCLEFIDAESYKIPKV